MIVILNPVILSFSGRLGNLVFYHSRGKQFARRYVIPCNPDTKAQRAGRERFASAVALWQSLPRYKKDQWNRRALSCGLNGYNHLISKHLKKEEPSDSLSSNDIDLISFIQRQSLSVSSSIDLYLNTDSFIPDTKSIFYSG